MVRHRLCRNRQCKSEGERRYIYSQGKCQACYQRDYRERSGNKAAGVSVSNNTSTDNAANELEQYILRQSAVFRRQAIQHEIDLGKSDDEILAAFTIDPVLKKYVATSKAPLVMLRRDIASLRSQDVDKSNLASGLERTRRLTLAQLADPKLVPTAKARLTQTLAKLEHDLAIARREAISVPGRGLVMRSMDERDPSYTDDSPDEEDETDLVDHEVDEDGWFVMVNGERRVVVWDKGHEPLPIFRQGGYRLPNGRAYQLPTEHVHDRRGNVLQGSMVVGRYRIGEEETCDDDPRR